jgi:hypothetical protein
LERAKQILSSREPRLVLVVKELRDLLQDVDDVANLSPHTLDIILRILDSHRVLVAKRDDLGGYFDYRDDACCAQKTVHDARSAMVKKQTDGSHFASLWANGAARPLLG